MKDIFDLFSWKQDEPTNSVLQSYISTYSIKQFKFKAFSVNREILCNTDFTEDFDAYYKLLKTKPGIYFLYENILNKGSQRKDGGKPFITHIYIGKADIRSDGSGILKRIEEHVTNDGKDNKIYHDKWKNALCIVNDTDSNDEQINPAITKALESWFIQLFGCLQSSSILQSDLICYNKKDESDGGYYSKELDTYFAAICSLLKFVGILNIEKDSDRDLQACAVEAKASSNKNVIDDIQSSVDSYIESQATKYSKDFIEESIRDKIIRDAFNDTFERYDQASVITNNNRIICAQDAANSRKSQMVMTPENICREMTELLPKDAFGSGDKFLLIYSKDFSFGKAVLERLDAINVLNGMPNEKRAEALVNFIRNCLYVVVPNIECAILNYKSLHDYFNQKMTRLNSLWYMDTTNFVIPHITVIINYDNIVKNDSSRIADIIRQRFNLKDDEMRFDVVIGNPPYNNDLYIPFVEVGHKIAMKYTLMITPAKWQAKGGKQNENFRENIAPYMGDIVYYPNSRDVFDITLQGGISYYLISKDKRELTNIDVIKNKCKSKRTFKNWRPEVGLDIDDIEISILNKVMNNSKSIVESTKVFYPIKGYFISVDADDKSFNEKFRDDVSDVKYVDAKQSIGIRKDLCNHKDKLGLYKILASGWSSNSSTFKYKMLAPNEVCGRKYINIFVGDKDQCESAVSYYSCKLIWWLVHRFFNVSKLNTYSFSFVPDPGAFDHIFTDEELYKKYNLTDDEIKLIESVIKERK